MEPTDDTELLRRYAEDQCDDAFGELVTRYINLVYSVALRRVRDPQNAEEITQAVFIILAKKARQLRHDKALSSWLFRATQLTANNFIRCEARRCRREQEAYMQTVTAESGENIWHRIAPMLDTAVAALNEKDRRAIVLRYYEGRNLREVGTALGASEEAAKKRVARGLDRLQRYFSKRGVNSTAASIACTISANSIQTAPLALAKSVTTVASTKGAIAAVSTLSLVKGTLSVMTWMKTKVAISMAMVVALVAGAEAWRDAARNSAILDQQPPQVGIQKSKFDENAHLWGNDGRMAGTGVSAATLVSAAYGYATTARTILATPLPGGRYTYIASLTNGNAEALQQEVRKEFGVVARAEARETNVMLLRWKAPNAPGLKASAFPMSEGYETWNPGYYESRSKMLGHLACVFEQYSNAPIVDETGFTNTCDIKLRWSPEDLKNRNWDSLNETLASLGLELTAGRRTIGMLVVERAAN